MKRHIISTIILSFLLWLPTASFSATIFDDFNSYDDGDLNGQGSWSADATYDIQGTFTKEGAKAVQGGLDNGFKSAQLSISVEANDTFGVYMGKDNSDGTCYYQLYENSTGLLYCLIEETSGSIMCCPADSSCSGADRITLGTASDDTYYFVEVEYSADNDEMRARLDGAAWSDWISTVNGFASVNRLNLYTNIAGSGLCYYDYISDEAYGGEEETPLVVDNNLVLAIILLGLFILQLFDFMRRLLTNAY